MQRPGADPENMQMTDFLCDFCGESWAESRPMVEGHHGSLICGVCLSAAYIAGVLSGESADAQGRTCTMCLEERTGPWWVSESHPGSMICNRCIRQGATTLEKDAESGWQKPAAR